MVVTINNIPLTFNGINADMYKEKLQPGPVTERTGNYDIRNYICDKWEGVKPGDNSGTMMNWFFDLKFSVEKGAYFTKEFSFDSDDPNDYTFDRGVHYMNYISSPMLLYRSACTFPENIIVDDGYKDIWTCFLKHKKTGSAIVLSEWKGTAQCGFDTRFYERKDAPKEYVDDAIELLNYMLSDQCAHPYDHLVAGTQV